MNGGPFELRYSDEFLKQLGKLDTSIRQRVISKTDELAEDPERGKPLTGPLAGKWSLRIGRWRVIYEIEREDSVVILLTVGPRDKVYG